MLVLTHLALVLASAHLNLILETWWPRPVSSAKLEPKNVLRKTSAKKLLQKILTTLDWVTRFLWYLARAARRKFYFCNLGARSVDLSYHWVSADLKNTKVEPCICRKHNGRATKNLQKVFFGIFLQKPDVRAYFFFWLNLYCKMVKNAIFRLREKIFGPGPRGKIFGDPSTAIIIADSRHPSQLSRFGELPQNLQ